MKINWFSPLPPAPTDIANYSVRVLKQLSQVADVRAWTVQKNYSKAIADLVDVCSYRVDKIDWKLLNQADINIYHLGNNPDFHDQIWQVSRISPGLVILHDLKLQHFFAGIYKDKLNDPNLYQVLMHHYYGTAGKRAAIDFWNGLIDINHLADHYPLTPLAIGDSFAVIVHSQFAYEALVPQESAYIAALPLPYASEITVKRQRQAGIKPIQLIIFGHLGKNRRLIPILEALSTLPNRNQFFLQIYGEIWNEKLIRQKIQELKLQHQVKLYGFVSEKELEQGLANADLALNLRYPTMGETSGSQLRIWSHGLPALVTQTGWYAEQPDTTVAFVRPDQEIEDIQHHLQRYLEQPELYQELGQNGKQHLEKNHSVATYVEHLLNVIAAAEPYRGYALVNPLIQCIAQHSHGWITPKFQPKFTNIVSPSIFELFHVNKP